MSDAIHHIHQRKRIHQKHEEYPHPHPGIRFLDRFLIIIAAVGPIVSVPQIIKLYETRAVEGFSIITWILLAVMNIFWIIYGIVHKEKPLVISYSLWFISNSLMVLGIILYS